MTTELIPISSTQKELKIFVSKEEFDTDYNQNLKNIQTNVRMHGFRPGRVPIKLIQQQYGAAIKQEVQEELTNKYFKEYVNQNNIHIIAPPALTDIKENEDGSQVYIIKFETLPDIELKDYKSLEIYEPYYKVTDKDIENKIKEIAKKMSKKEETNIVADYDHLLTVDVHRINADTGEDMQMEKFADLMIDLQENMPDFRDDFLNKKIGDEVISPLHTELKSGEKITEKYIIKKIEKFIISEINDEFAKIASNDKFDNLEDYKQFIGFDLQKYWDDYTRQLTKEQMLSNLLELHNDVEIPDVLLESMKSDVIKSSKKRYPNVDFQNENDNEILDKVTKRTAVLELVKNKIIEKEKIEIEDYDYENKVDELFANMPEFQNIGTPKEELVKVLKADENIKRELLQSKLIDFLLGFTKTNEVEYAEFMEKYYKPLEVFRQRFDENI